MMDYQNWAWYEWTLAVMAASAVLGIVGAVGLMAYTLWLTRDADDIIKNKEQQSLDLDKDVVLERNDGSTEKIHMSGRLTKPLQPMETVRIL
jgi:hypothetical protein